MAWIIIPVYFAGVTVVRFRRTRGGTPHNVIDRVGQGWHLLSFVTLAVVVIGGIQGWLTGQARIAAIVLASVSLVARVVYDLGGKHWLLASLAARAARQDHA